jgi:hypothetical protein
MIRYRILVPILIAATVLLLLTPPLLGLAIGALNYHGTCYGFTDGSWPCSWQEYTSDQVFWSALMDIPLGFFLLACWLVFAGLWFFTRRRGPAGGLPLSLVLLIPIGGCGLDFLFMTLFSLFIRLSYGLTR